MGTFNGNLLKDLSRATDELEEFSGSVDNRTNKDFVASYESSV